MTVSKLPEESKSKIHKAQSYSSIISGGNCMAQQHIACYIYMVLLYICINKSWPSKQKNQSANNCGPHAQQGENEREKSLVFPL